MSYDYSEALAELDKRTTLADLIDLVKNTSARVENATANVTSLLYSGTIKGENAWEVAKALSNNTVDEFGANRYVRVDDTPVGKLLTRSETPLFSSKLNAAVGVELAATIPGYNDLPATERNVLREEFVRRILNNTDAQGTRLPYAPDKLSLWDLASKNFVEQATGEFRLIADNVSDSSILKQTELKALLSKSADIFGDQRIDGIELRHLLAAGGSEQAIDSMLAWGICGVRHDLKGCDSLSHGSTSKILRQRRTPARHTPRQQPRADLRQRRRLPVLQGSSS